MGAELTVADRILAALAKSQKIDVRTIPTAPFIAA